jgi:hypothetical protein
MLGRLVIFLNLALFPLAIHAQNQPNYSFKIFYNGTPTAEQVERVERIAAPFKSVTGARTRLSVPSSSKILKHVKGRFGTPFEISVKPPKETESIKAQIADESGKLLTGFTDKIKNDAKEEFSFQDCPEDASSNVLKNLGEQKQMSGMFGDYLFVQESLVPKDVDLAKKSFGSGVKIMKLPKKMPKMMSSMITGINIKCLPTRVRFSSDGLQQHIGAHALLNYSQKKPYAMSEDVKKLWEEHFGTARYVSPLKDVAKAQNKS